MAPRIAAISGLTAPDDYHLAFSPERIDPGSPVHGLANTPRAVGGLDQAAAAQLQRRRGRLSWPQANR